MFGRSKQKDKSMRNQRVVGWSISFENVLEDPIGLKTFTEFLKREFSAENIMFWVACKQYSTLNDKSQMIKLAKDIYDLHLRPGATEAVNINSHSRQYVLLHLQNPPHDLFTQAEREIFTLMKFDCYQRFLKSELYSDCMTAEKLGKPMPCAYLTNSKSPSRTRFRSKSRDRNRIQHAKKSNSAHYSISNELETPSTEEPSTNRRSYMSSRKEIDALWNRLQKRLDDQRGTELNFDIPDFLCNDDTTVTSKAQRENSHVNNKCYPKQLEYQRSDKNQYYSKVPKVEYGRGPTIHLTQPMKEALPKTTENRLFQGSPVKVGGIPSTWTNPFLHATVAGRLE
ncbi:regulator of G-protein signaling loco [Caerostris extrusa]|uniref:Regulator of G-protein signaling loco n=1 Tax=Caerostris extrusa TaxID=172846 RepID=A0AAV4X5V5_CAEEX|nr:regulator of G-protein signaling loco [Caerostris extrusa]